jgi:hypothetical protein
MGAFGVALFVKERMALGQTVEKHYDLRQLRSREVFYREPFVCGGGTEKCDLKCKVNVIEINGKKYPFGGACDKYSTIASAPQQQSSRFDLVELRNNCCLTNMAHTVIQPPQQRLSHQRLVPHHSLYPLYSHFFSELGYKVVMPAEPDLRGLEHEKHLVLLSGAALALFFQGINRHETRFHLCTQCTRNAMRTRGRPPEARF